MALIKQIAVAAILVSGMLLFLLSPVQVLVVHDGETAFLRVPCVLGNGFHTRYIHSVQRTPVEDYYRVVDGRIWQWEECVVSHNAGLPVGEPRNGRFISDGRWFRFRGGRYVWTVLYERVGTADIGRNELFLTAPVKIEYDLYKILPAKRIAYSLDQEPLLSAFRNEKTDPAR